MQRWILKTGTTDLNGLALEDAPKPEPGSGEVRVRVHAASLNRRDQLILTGQYGMKIAEPLVPLSDGAGVIDAVGTGVGKWSVGDRVTSVYYKDWVDGPPVPDMGWGLGSPGQPGVLAEYVVLAADRVAAAPQTLTLLEAATLPCAALTAWTALNGNRPYTNRRIGQGDKVLVLGTGAVSLFALLLARAAGAEVIGTSSQDAKLKQLRALGATDGINYKTMPNWGEEVSKRTGGGVQRVVNAAGGDAMDQSILALAFGGEIAFMGLFTEADTPPNLLFLMMKGASIRGTTVGGSAALADLISAVDAAGIKPPIDRVLPFEQAKDAYQAADSPELFGKVVIEVAKE